MPRVIKGSIADIAKKIDEATKAVEGLEVGVLAQGLDDTVSLFADIRNRQEQVNRLSAKLAKLANELSFEVIPEIFQRTNTESPYNHVRGKFTLATRTNASVLDGQKDAAYAWLRKNDLGDIIIETIPWQTLGATAADLIKEGKELPDDLFEVSARVYTRFTPKGKKDA